MTDEYESHSDAITLLDKPREVLLTADERAALDAAFERGDHTEVRRLVEQGARRAATNPNRSRSPMPRTPPKKTTAADAAQSERDARDRMQRDAANAYQRPYRAPRRATAPNRDNATPPLTANRDAGKWSREQWERAEKAALRAMNSASALRWRGVR